MTGIITDIQHFSLHDGAGIRTTVFMKGCNLRCAWCHNPETLQLKPEPAYYPAKCIHCGHCQTGCPTGARTTIGREMSVREGLNQILRDQDYYTSSGGGVTVSGGEPFMQPAFLRELLRACREAGLNTNVETNLSMPWDVIEPCLPNLDHIYFDIKLFDPNLHRQWTGAGNETILQNAKRIGDSGVPFTVRTPLIPGVTDTEDNIRGIASFVADLGPSPEYELLNYNVLAEAKYAPVGLTYPLSGARPLPKERLRALCEIAGTAGVRCTVRKG